jgi:hypothetical protein
MAHIYIKHLDDTKERFVVTPQCTIEMLKEMIRDTCGFSIDQQRLVHGGKDLFNERTIQDYDIESGSTIFLMLRLRGGMFHASSGRIGQVIISKLNSF